MTSKIIAFEPREEGRLRSISARRLGYGPDHPNEDLHRQLEELIAAGLRDMVAGHFDIWANYLGPSERAKAKALAEVHGDSINPTPAIPSDPEEENRFPENRGILMPQRSSVITRELMQEQISLLSRNELKWRYAHIAGSKARLKWEHHHSYGDIPGEPPDFLLITDEKNILRVYVREDANSDCKIRPDTLFGAQCEKAAASNLGKLMNETIADPDLPEAMAEIEHQLSFVSRNQEVKRHKNRFPEKKIFLRYERWKQSRKL